MSLNEKSKPTYGTAPAVDSGATKGSRRGVVVGLAAAACFTLGFFPFTGGESTGVGAGPAVNTGAGMPGAGGEDVGFGVPHSHKTTPGGGVAAQGY